MPAIGTSGSMSGGMGNGVLATVPQATAPILDSTNFPLAVDRPQRMLSVGNRTFVR